MGVVDQHSHSPLPSRDTSVYHCRASWLKEKAEADQAALGFDGRYWALHGKVYDLTQYVKAHPGGSDWLALTRGTDITELVVTHHLYEEKLEPILAKYYVCDVARPPGRARVYSFEPQGFYRRLKARVKEQLRGQPRGPTSDLQAMASALLITYAALFGWACYSGSKRALVAASLLLHPILGLGHNAIHQGPTLYRFCTDLTLFSSWEWRQSHCISHHTYPNTYWDFEVWALEPFVFSLEERQDRSSVLVWVWLWGLICIFTLHEGLFRLWNILTLQQRPRLENALPLLQLALLVWGTGWVGGVLRWVVHHVIGSILLAVVALPVHHSAYAWTEGRGHAAEDFGEHIIQTTQDYSKGAPLLASLLFFQLFNNHTLHHLFPTVDQSRLPALEGALQDTCRECKIEYRSYRHSELLASTLRKWLIEPWEAKGAAPAAAGGAAKDCAKDVYRQQ